MFSSLIRFTSRTTYRGSKGSGAGQSGKTSSKSSPSSRPTLVAATLAGRVFKQSQRGLYDGAVLQSGNNLPKSRKKTARTWKPNIQRTKIYSETLRRLLPLKLTTRTMRTVKKLGGIDRYLVATRDDKLGTFGRDLRAKLATKVRQQAESEEQKQKQKQKQIKSQKLNHLSVGLGQSHGIQNQSQSRSNQNQQ